MSLVALVPLRVNTECRQDHSMPTPLPNAGSKAPWWLAVIKDNNAGGRSWVAFCGAHCLSASCVAWKQRLRELGSIKGCIPVCSAMAYTLRQNSWSWVVITFAHGEPGVCLSQGDTERQSSYVYWEPRSRWRVKGICRVRKQTWVCISVLLLWTAEASTTQWD